MDHSLPLTPAVPTSVPATPLPLRFALPPGWPSPSVDWVAANQGWDPPVGWTPVPGVAPAPAGWVWWSRDPVGWRAMAGPVTDSFRNGIVLGAVFFVVGLALTVLPLTLHTSFGFIFWGAIVFGPINVARNIGALRKSNAAFVTFVRAKASEIRQTLDTSSYSEYLASSPADPAPFDRFLARRADEAWSSTGRWPVTQNHLGVTEQFRIPAPAGVRGRRIGTLVFAGLAAVALIAVVASSLSAPSGSGAQGLVGAGTTSGSTGTAGSPSSKYDVAWNFVRDGAPTTATCTNSGDCWVVRLRADPSCTDAALMVDFFTTETAQAPERSKDFSVALVDGKADVAVPAATSSEKYADVYQARCVLRK
jgi:hypothetical protein